MCPGAGRPYPPHGKVSDLRRRFATPWLKPPPECESLAFPCRILFCALQLACSFSRIRSVCAIIS